MNKRTNDNLELAFSATQSGSTLPGVMIKDAEIAVSQLISAVGTATWLRGALQLQGEDKPFPWQEELLKQFLEGRISGALDIPTGLGKTAVMAIWLVARALGAPIPRRLAYVVDRRAVVDQATEVAAALRAYIESNRDFRQALGLRKRSLPISTLRGQYVDNREWLEDPASPAIIVGTVDMVGSRLLFEGYGVSRKMRPYHAGLLGSDTLVVLDEAHLVPPFEKLLESIAEGGTGFRPRDDAARAIAPSFKLLSLSATGRRRADEDSSGLTGKDLENEVVLRRLNAPKRLVLHPFNDPKNLPEVLAEIAWELTGNGTRPVRCIVFCDKRSDAESAAKSIKKRADKEKIAIHSELFVGGRRVYERQRLVRWLKEHGFMAGVEVELDCPAFLFATSAGEVGVDLDADHMVSDLVTWERMVQRLGRVNRRGAGKADVIVVVPRPPTTLKAARKKGPAERSKKEIETVLEYERTLTLAKPLKRLPLADSGRDASPGAIRSLKLRAEMDESLAAILEAATSPPPLRPALTRPLVDAWSMTSLEGHTGRPDIAPWLRGWIEDDKPQTRVIWRTFLPVRMDGRDPNPKEVEDFFEAAPPQLSEVLETETYRVTAWLADRAQAVIAASKRTVPVEHDNEQERDDTRNTPPLQRDDVAAIVLSSAGELREMRKLKDLDPDQGGVGGSKEGRKKLEETLIGAMLVVDARLAGLSPEGLLDSKSDALVRTPETGEWQDPGAPDPNPDAALVPFRIRNAGPGSDEAKDKGWRPSHTFVLEVSDEEPTRWLIVDKRLGAATTEDNRAIGRTQLLNEHRACVVRCAIDLARRLGLPREHRRMLKVAALLHDEGKRASRWQRAFNAPFDGGVYAKTHGPVNVALLDGYRHEFGSVLIAARDSRIQALPEELRDLALHLISAHHGFARPVIRRSGCDDAPPSVLERHAIDVALRFARLQKRWGPWGLAWWESLLRAADQRASREHDRGDPTLPQERR